MLPALIASLVVYEDCYEYVSAVGDIRDALGLSTTGCVTTSAVYDGPVPYPGFCDGMILTNITESCISSGEFYTCERFEAVTPLLSPWNYGDLSDLCVTPTAHFEWNQCGITLIPALAPTEAECDYYASGDDTDSSDAIPAAGWAGIGVGAGIVVVAIAFFVFRSTSRSYRQFM